MDNSVRLQSTAAEPSDAVVAAGASQRTAEHDPQRFAIPEGLSVQPKAAGRPTVIDVTMSDDVPVIRFDDHRRESESASPSPSDDTDSDEISEYIGHYGRWQFFWTFLLALFQIPCTWQIFAYVFQVRF